MVRKFIAQESLTEVEVSVTNIKELVLKKATSVSKVEESISKNL